MTKKYTLLCAFLSLAAFVLVLMISSRLWFRLDLTRNKAYTISDVSRNLYKEIEDEVRITYFVSDRLAAARPMPQAISDLLEEYAAHSRGKIKYLRRDPAKGDLTQAVEELGIIPQQISVIEKNEETLATVYTGILIEYLERREVLPVVFSLNTLEYDLSSRIRSLVREREREAGVLLGNPNRQWPRDYGHLNQELSFSGYRVRVLNAGEEIPDALPMLFVIGGAEELDEWALYRIDRYIRGGGKALFALNGVFVDYQGGLEARPVQDQGLLAMLAAYGAVVRPVLVLDSQALNLSYQIQSRNGFIQQRIIRYPEWIGVRNSNPLHPVTAMFNGLDLYWASPLELSPPPQVSAETLLSTSDGAWLMTRDFNANPDMVPYFEAEAAETGGSRVLAASLSGTFPSAFEGRPKPVREGSAEELPDLRTEAGPSRIIVVGDEDFASSLMQATRGEGRNPDFLLKAADWLCSDDDLMGIRNRQAMSGRLDRIEDQERRAGAMNFSRTLNVILIPLAVIVTGIVLAMRRRMKVSGKKEESHG
jgi:gliding-associated putative ABC transporter substrate-binding component GldG